MIVSGGTLYLWVTSAIRGNRSPARYVGEGPFKRALFGGLKGGQRLGARVVDTTHHRKPGSVVLEYDSRPGHRRALPHGLRHLELGRNGALHLDKLPGLSQGVEKLPEILVRQCDAPPDRAVC